MSKTGLFLGGVPTEPDIRRLFETFPNLKPGDEVTHDELSRVIGHDRKDNRYRTVVGQWRKQMLKTHNIDMKAVPSVGYRVLDSIERVGAGVKDYGSGVRKIARSEGRIRRVPMETLPQEQQRVTEHTLRHISATVDAARRASKEIAVKFTPQAQLPRARPVR